MKRDEIRKILENEELDLDARVKAIMGLHGSSVEDLRQRHDDLQSRLTELESRGADYDTVLQERDTLRAEKADREMSDRLTAVVGGKKFVNPYTAEGVRKAFAEAVALPDNSGKTDAEIYASIADGNEAAWFANPITVNMTPSAGRVTAPDEATALIDEKYAGNPFYKKTT